MTRTVCILRFFVAACLLATSARAAEKIYAVQMHIHGSASEGTGTWYTHTIQNARAGVDVLWWSDHDDRLQLYQMQYADAFDFESGLKKTVQSSYTEGSTAKTFGWEERLNEFGSGAKVELSSVRARSGSKSMRMTATAPPGVPGWKRLGWAYSAWRRENFRCLLSEVTVKVAVWPPADIATNRNIALGVQLVLSHGENNVENDLIYLTLPSVPAGNRNVQYRILPPLVPNQWNVLTLRVSEDVRSAYPEKDDQALRGIIVGVLARNGARVEAFWDDLQVQVEGPTGDALVEKERQVAAERYSQGVHHHVGNEISKIPHLNAFGSAVPLLDYHSYDRSRHPKAAVDFVHAHGGLVSYNHMFGAADYRDFPSEAEKQAFVEKTAEDLISNRVYGADTLEIYIQRGLPIQYFLGIWDRIIKANIFVTGTGTSDHHDATPLATYLNPFVSWIYAESDSEADLMAGLRKGRVFFGNPFSFDPNGGFDLSTPEGYRMGQTVPTSASSHTVTLAITGLRAGDVVKLVENGAVTKTWTATGTSFGVSRAVNVGSGNVVRAEVWTSDGKPKAFSNPIWFLKRPVGFPLPPERVPPGVTP